MMRRLSAAAVFLFLFASTGAVGQPPPAADFDETTLRQAGIQADAAHLLEHLGYFLRNDGDPSAINALVEQLAEPRFEKRDEAARALIAAGRPALAALRRAQKKQEDPEVRSRATHCIAVIETLLDPDLTLAAVRRLVALRADGAAERFLELLPVVDWEIQDEIVHGLPQVARRDGKLDTALLAALGDRLPQRRAAAALAVALRGGDRDRAAVGKLLEDGDAEVRLRAAQGLLAVHDAAGLPALIALLNEPAVEISWSAEELLHWVAGEQAPAAKVGLSSAAERQKAVEAWTAWHKERAAKIDWDKLDQAPQRPGLYLACDSYSIWLGGCVGGRRCTLTKRPAHDALLLPDNQLLVAQFNTGAEVVKYGLDGTVLWQRRQRNGLDYVMCQRLPNGHFLFVSPQNIVEMTADGEQVSAVAFDEERNVADAWQPRTGPLLCRWDTGMAAVDRTSGRVLEHGEAPARHFDRLHKMAVLRDGRCVVADYLNNRLLETNARGQILRVLPTHNPYSVAPLRDGHYLVVNNFNTERRILEMDPAGRTLWEVYVPEAVYRVRPVLDRVRIGFDQPRPPDFNLDAPAYRVPGLRDPDPLVRFRSARALCYLRPTDADSIDALTAALDDREMNVREFAVTALAEIGEPAVPALIRALRKGTPTCRAGAVLALGKIGSAAAGAVPALIALVKDGQPAMDLRQSAVAALGRIGPAAKPAVSALLDALKSDNDHLRYVAGASVVSIAPDNPAVVQGLIGAFRDARFPEGQDAAAVGFDVLGPRAKAALPVLIETVQSSAAPVLLRRRAAVALGSMEREAKPAVPPLAALLNDGQQPLELRAAIARSLGTLGATAKPAIPVFRDLLHDPKLSPDLAGDLLEGLGNIGPDAVVALVSVVKDGHASVGRRSEAIRQLGKLGSAAAAALPELENAVKDTDDRISELAGWAVSRIKDRCREQQTPLN